MITGVCRVAATFCAVCVLSGCVGVDSTKERTGGPSVLGGGKHTQILYCWYVEDDGSGRSGYVAIDAIWSYAPPDGGGLFQSIDEVRSAMRAQGIRPSQFVAAVMVTPEGWSTRNLTQGERKALVAN
jgi:hypothetical protein